MSTAAAVTELNKVKPNPPERCRVLDKGDVPVKSISLDPSRASMLPGAVTSGLHVGKRGVQGWTCHSIFLVARVRAFQVVFKNSGGKEEVHMVPEHMVVDWQPEEKQS